MAGLKPATRTKRAARTDSDSTLRVPTFRPPQKAQLRSAATKVRFGPKAAAEH